MGRSNPEPGKPGPGRAPGSRSKAVAAKEAISLAADRLGGVDRLVAWVQEDAKNEQTFWATIYPKLMPLQVKGAGEAGEHLHSITVKFVRAAR